MENPWLDVNQLAPGHIIYRRRENGKGYDHVEIRNIPRKHVDKVMVYGVHLREGARSYHANGYLVAVNYPEVCCCVCVMRALLTALDHCQVYCEVTRNLFQASSNRYVKTYQRVAATVRTLRG